MWTLKQWYKGTYLQGRNRHRHKEQTCGRRVESGDGMNWEVRIDIYALVRGKWLAGGTLLYGTGSSAQCSVMT